MHRIPVIALIILMLAVPISGFAQSATPSASPSAASGDFAGLVDIGGRNLYLECRGEGGPTVILESGAGGRADVWTRDLQQPEGERTMVLPGGGPVHPRLRLRPARDDGRGQPFPRPVRSALLPQSQ